MEIKDQDEWTFVKYGIREDALQEEDRQYKNQVHQERRDYIDGLFLHKKKNIVKILCFGTP